MMNTDHASTTADLTAAAAKSGMTPPPPTMNAKHRAMLDQLTAAQGDFDSIYARQQVMAHQEALSVAQSYASGGDDRNLKAVAGKAAPIIARHLEMARRLPGGA